MMWECITAQRAYTGKNSGTVILAISSGKGRLQLPQTAPQTYRVSAGLPPHLYLPSRAIEARIKFELAIEHGIAIHKSKGHGILQTNNSIYA
jgi:hypothetical protein